MSIPITVVTGFLGAGKTTLILSLLPQLAKHYKVVLLKNEFGDVQVDSKLAEHSSLAAVAEILNGCMCCVLVGQMHDACLEIRDKYHPDRIIIECSGSAFPATLAIQLRELERQTHGGFKLDTIVTVIDAENFIGYEDRSPTAKLQASYTDILVINKWEHVSERQLDIVLDHLNTLNDLTPKIRCRGRNGVDPNLIFGLQSKLALDDSLQNPIHNDEVETMSIHKGIQATRYIEKDVLETALQRVSKESVWRIKGFVQLQDGLYILNWAFGRHDLTLLEGGRVGDFVVKLTVMGEKGELQKRIRGLISDLDA